MIWGDPHFKKPPIELRVFFFAFSAVAKDFNLYPLVAGEATLNPSLSELPLLARPVILIAWGTPC